MVKFRQPTDDPGLLDAAKIAHGTERGICEGKKSIQACSRRPRHPSLQVRQKRR
jgi:hypothetical protein